jgi:hypothetical protein
LNTIVLHEAAHLGRRDHWTNLAQKVLHALFFIHPAVWWIARRITLAREMACDDAVLERVSNPRAYAECLVSVAEKSLLRRGLTLVQAAVSRARQTTLRIASILDARRPGATRVWKPGLVLVTGVSLVCVSMVEHAPRLVRFADGGLVPPPIAVDSSVDHLGASGRATLVPAALHWNSNPAAPAALPQARTKHAPKNPPRPSPLIRTKAMVVKPPQPTVVLTSAQEQIAPPTVLVVMRSVQSDEAGSVVWSLTVWRVIVTPESKIPKAIAPKSI